MNVKFSLVTLIAGMLMSVYTNAQTRAYVQEDILLKPYTDPSVIDTLPVSGKSTTIMYMDGLGRALQRVAVKASPSQNDMIQPYAYDNLGRQTTGYLPYTYNGGGNYQSTAISTQQPAFYANGSGDKVADDAKPYNQQLFENSPLQRVLSIGNVGTGFQPISGDHYKTVSYRTNSSSDADIILWKPDGTRTTIYADYSLSVMEGTDEGGAKTLTYTDKLGQLVLKRQLVTASPVAYLDTYYIYNEGGQLIYIVPPQATALIIANNYGNFGNTAVSNLIFQFGYDYRGRLTTKKVPGADAMNVIYDPLERPVLMQNAKLKATNQWNYIKYDSKGRAIAQGLYTNTTYTTQATMQAYVDGLDYSTYWFETRTSSSGAGYYSNNVFPNINIYGLAYSYYDNYDLNQDGTDDYSYITQSISGEGTAVTFNRGMPTINRKRTVGQGLADMWLISIVFYDKYGHAIQQQSNNHLYSTVSDIKTISYKFSGVPIQSKTTKVVGTFTSNTTTVLITFSYDHRDRVTLLQQKYNGQSTFKLAGYTYNELGQLIDKQLHTPFGGSTWLQSIDYRYTIRGQLSSINNSKLIADANNDDTNDVFGINLLYNETDSNLGNTAEYTGMLSGSKWMTVDGSGTKGYERSYKYSYDQMNRYTAANYAERSTTGTGAFNINVNGFTEYNLTYNENGNLLTLRRDSSMQGGTYSNTDYLGYTYDTNNPNQLSKVTDGTTPQFVNSGFRNLTGTTTGTYTYDSSGNTTGDPYKGLSITYNYLNKTDKITSTQDAGKYVYYAYDGGGTLLRKQIYSAGTIQSTTDYIDGFVYSGAGNNTAHTMGYFATPEGRVRNNAGTFINEYVITDQQGNARVTFDNGGTGATARVIQENSYYPSGLIMPNSTVSTPTVPNKKLYNDESEWQNDLGNSLPDYYQTFYRNYDATIGRFIAVDPMAEQTGELSPYQYGNNNPVMLNDPMGDYVVIPNAVSTNGVNFLTVATTNLTQFRNMFKRDSEAELGSLTIDMQNEIIDYNGHGGPYILLSMNELEDAVYAKAKYGSDALRFGPGYIKIEYQTGSNVGMDPTITWHSQTIKVGQGASEGGQYKTIDNSWDAFTHYYSGNGQPVRLGPNTVAALLNSKQFKASYRNIKSGHVNTTNGRFNVNLTDAIFHVGRTNVTWSISNEGHKYTVVFNLFVDDGFWDPDFIDERYLKGPKFVPDGKGPNLERGGTPYDYIPSTVIFKFERP
ncbi:hypothetical protein FFF34_015000 [Inquilinus sp. KBS0705]|nr:hypothetical protein FFF34_015000 [Inquilinus sp. KBS0705]